MITNSSTNNSFSTRIESHDLDQIYETLNKTKNLREIENFLIQKLEQNNSENNNENILDFIENEHQIPKESESEEIAKILSELNTQELTQIQQKQEEKIRQLEEQLKQN